MKSGFKDFFYFNPKERRGILILLMLIALVIIVKQNLHNILDKPQWPTDKLDDYLSKLELDSNSNEIFTKNENKFFGSPPFAFNPNNLEINGWIQLGLSKKQAQTILNYLNKGGEFVQKPDLKKIYSISDDFYEFIEDSILLPSSINKVEGSRFLQKKQEDLRTENRHSNIEEASKVIFLNKSDTSDWQSLYGIGSVYANRIVKYRSSLGGFVSSAQLYEVWGIQDSVLDRVINQIKVDTAKLSSLNINTLEAKELKMHPYINWNIANAIYNYRKAHGDYKAIEDIKKIHIVDDSLFNRIKPYLSK